jgi:hypothetical protein
MAPEPAPCISDPSSPVRVVGGFGNEHGTLSVADATDTLAIFSVGSNLRWLEPGATAFGAGQTLHYSYTSDPRKILAFPLSPRAIAAVNYYMGVLSYGVYLKP